MLYQSESASWYGTDIFLSKYKYREKVGGYFSYNEKDKFKCIFFSNDATPKVIGEITFDNKFDVNTAVDNLTEREFTKQESELY